MKIKLEKTWNEAVVAYLKTPSLHSNVAAEINRKSLMTVDYPLLKFDWRESRMYIQLSLMLELYCRVVCLTV